MAGLNSAEAVRSRVALGEVTWTGPLILLVARSTLLVTGQALVAGILLARGRPSPWSAAGAWWTVYGTLADVGCLVLMAGFARKEGLRLRDLIGRPVLRRGRDLFLGLGFFLLVFPLFLFAPFAAGWLVYGSEGLGSQVGLLAGRVLPPWAIVYSLSVWWLAWSPTEETTYQGYVLPRLEALSSRRWAAVLVVAFWWALQHAFLPLIPDWRYVAWRFLAFLPGVIALVLIYLRIRRLPPLIVAHWPMDVSAALLTLRLGA